MAVSTIPAAPTTSAAPAATAALPLAARTDRDLDHRLWTVDLTREHGFEPLEVEGTLPADLRGTLYRNGPGLFGQFGRRYLHPFEGDGAITALRLDGTRALGASRVTPTAGLVAERAAGTLLGGFSAPWPRRIAGALRGTRKNTANTSALIWQGRLLALNEGGAATELDPRDLAFLGETDLGVVTTTFSAHPHRVAARRATYNFGIAYGRHTELHLYELPDVGPARRLAAIPLPGPPMLHDFIATDTHLVFFLSPVRISVPRMLLQVGGFERLFQWRPQLGTEIICVPIDDPARVIRFSVDAFYQWHFANAFTRGRELVIDYVRYPNFDTFYDLGDGARLAGALADGRYHRATIDLDARRMRDERVADVAAEFPTVAPRAAGREHAFTYAALGELGAIGKLDTRTGALTAHVLPPTQRASEPLFVARAGAIAEDDGYVLSLCHDAPRDRAFFAIYDAQHLADGPLARAWLDHHVPITFHGAWAPEPAST